MANTFWTNRRVLVTGACGFIGSHLVDALLSAGAHVRGVDLYTSTSERGHLADRDSPALEILLGDISDPYFVQDTMEDVDTVFHLAALIGIPYSYAAPYHYVKTNVDGTLAVLEAARRSSVRRLVHTSTSETYGSAQYQPIDEQHPIVGQSPYAASKIAADQLALSYYRSFDLPVVVCRPFNTYGPRQSMRALLPTLMAQALFASVIKVGTLAPVRDMNYVDDTVRGFLSIGAAQEIEGEVFNIGSGVGRTVNELIELVCSVTNSVKPIEVAADRVRPPKSEVMALLCDYSKANSAFGYSPKVGIETGLARLRDYLVSSPPSRPGNYAI
jgi:UDP-glucose 4-epimerase